MGKFLSSLGFKCLGLGQWYEFTDGDCVRCCQPDAVAFNYDTMTGIIFEVKLKHTFRSWWQLHKLYLPVLQAFAPELTWKVVTIFLHRDPMDYYPEPFETVHSLAFHSLRMLPYTNLFRYKP